MTDESASPASPPPDARPFVVAFVGFVIVAVLAFFLLREDGDLEVLRPDAVRSVDDDTVTAVVDSLPGCTQIARSQVDVSDSETVFVELVVRTDDDCADPASPAAVQIDLPQPLAGRRVVPGVGRVEIACEAAPLPGRDSAVGSGWRCAPEG